MSAAASTLAACLLACTAIASAAPREQWLKYHTGPEPRSYKWLDLATNSPANIPLPKTQPEPFFGRWTNAFDTAGGRWFCLDRSKPGGAFDRLTFDLNGNGRLDDDTPTTASRRDSYMIWFNPIKIVFKGADGPFSYHLIARSYVSPGSTPRLLAGSGGWYAGTVDFNGNRHQVELIDNSVNAVFNDYQDATGEADLLHIGGESGRQRFVGRYLELDDQLFQLDISPDGAFLKVQPASDVTMGRVQAPAGITEVIALGDNGHFIRKPTNGTFLLPAGQYQIHGWTMERKDDNGVPWTLTASPAGSVSQFTVKPSANLTPSMPIGEPVFAALQATESRSELNLSLNLVGSLGESIDILRAKIRPRAPQLQVAGPGYSATRNFEYG